MEVHLVFLVTTSLQATTIIQEEEEEEDTADSTVTEDVHRYVYRLFHCEAVPVKNAFRHKSIMILNGISINVM